jgi:hypothetical protein
MSLDIHTAVQTALIITTSLIVILIWRGIVSIRNAKQLPFFRMRRNRMMNGWRMLFAAAFFILVAVLLNGQLEPFVYRFFPPTATVTLTPTITLTPFMPADVQERFSSTTTPAPGAVFSTLTFTDGLDALYRPLELGTVFANPIDHMYAVFSYDGMTPKAQWTALWYRNGELVYYETKPWDGETGGLGYTDWQPQPEEWQPGTYEVQIFVGNDWKVSGFFEVTGEAPTAAPSQTPTASATLTRSPTLTRTPRPSRTPTVIRPTRTPYIRPTVTLTRTPYPTLTRTPVTPSITPQQTRTRTATPQP